MSKTVLGLLVYMKLKEQQQDAEMRAIDWVAPDRRPPWLQAWQADSRGDLTLSNLIFMRDGLDSRESYAPWSAVPRMLWGTDDAAAHAGSASSEAPPGQRFRYLSATANILSRLLRAQFDSDADYWRYPRAALFDPIGARSAVIEADPSGTFIASSYLWATPLDWARIGEVLRRDGLVGDKRVFAAGWQRFAGTPPPGDDPAALGYGAHVWLAGVPNSTACGPDHGLPADTFLLSGHWSQLMAVIPSREAVVLRLGMTLDRSRFDGCGFIRNVLAALPAALPTDPPAAVPGNGPR
jgi:CubicO group peptidase (beta-lactamase class C family)